MVTVPKTIHMPPSSPLPIVKIGFVLVAALVIALVVFLYNNMGNHRVLSGFAGYVYTKPIISSNQFEKVLIGPASTGFTWRREVSKVSITPETTIEHFSTQDNTAILGKDKLPISCQASMVFRLNPQRIKEFMEEYGGIAQTSGQNDDEKADEIMNFAYKNFIQQPFRTAVRTELSKYPALEASSNLQKISDDVLAQVRQRLEKTPFVVDSVAVGETNPPPPIIEAVVNKVKATQENERKAIELEIAQKDIAIQKAKGEAEGTLKYEIAKQEAQGRIAQGKAEAEVSLAQAEVKAKGTILEAKAEAEGIALKEKAMGPNVLRAKMYENMLNNAKVYLPSSASDKNTGMPVFGVLNLNDQQQAK